MIKNIVLNLPKLFNPQESVYTEISKYSKEYVKTLTEEERKAIFVYSSSGYKAINYRLRKQNYATSATLIDSGLDKFYFDKPFKVYRKLTIHSGLKEFLENCKQTGYILDKAYQSSSMLITGYDINYDVILEIDIENPSCGAFIKPICFEPREEEFLIKRNTKLDIENISQIDFDCYEIKCKIK